MRSRHNVLIVVALLIAATPAFAHKLIVEHQIRLGQRVRIESWFETGDSAVGASVKVQGRAGVVIAEGVLDEKGVFFFPFKEAQDLRVIVNDGMGHRVELRIKAKELSDGMTRDGAGRAAASLATPVSAAAVTLLDEETPSNEEEATTVGRGGVDINKVLIGVGIFVVLAAVAALRARK